MADRGVLGGVVPVGVPPDDPGEAGGGAFFLNVLGNFFGNGEGAFYAAVGAALGNREGIQDVGDVGVGGAGSFVVEKHDAVEELEDVFLLLEAVPAGTLARPRSMRA